MFQRVCANVAVRCVEFCSYCFKYLNESCLQSAKFFVWCYMKSARNTIQHEREQWMLGVGQFWWTPTYPSSVPSTIILLPFPFDGRLNYSNFKFEITYKSDSHVKFTPLLCCQLSHYQKWASNMNSCYTACKQYSNTEEDCLVAFIGLVTLKNFICRFKR